jgi:hypothetical protein
MNAWNHTAWIVAKLAWSPRKWIDCHPILKEQGTTVKSFEEVYAALVSEHKKPDEVLAESMLTEDEIAARYEWWLKQNSRSDL